MKFILILVPWNFTTVYGIIVQNIEACMVVHNILKVGVQMLIELSILSTWIDIFKKDH